MTEADLMNKLRVDVTKRLSHEDFPPDPNAAPEIPPEILAAMVVGTLNMLTTSWAMDSNFPVFAKLEEARALFEHVICRGDT